ncbi:MAG: RsmE family RNA methyltransferase [Candidatus Didemnitutus sp.]|nr:RsmE family RNA methyltransferase [Candidatus Didemnitutus sp.]
MNLALFSPDEISHPLPRSDRRARHVLDVLHGTVGTQFDVGLVNGPRGKATVQSIDAEAISLAFEWTVPPPAADPITLLIGLSRPQTARDILREATTLGVSAIHFVATEKTEPGYAHSTLWRDGEWQRHVLAGAEQAFSTQVPTVTADSKLAAALTTLPPEVLRLALDNYEATAPLAGYAGWRDASPATPVVLAFGPERGWSPRDRQELKTADFPFVHLGSRVYRLETAVIAALTLVKSARGTWSA